MPQPSDLELFLKTADGESSGGTLLSAAGSSALPQPQVVSRLAPGKRGPVGMGFRNNFTRVNSGAPPVPDAGASSQKSLLPKLGSFMSQASRPNLQDLVKAASAGAMTRVAIEEEARRQAGEPVEKTASESPVNISSKEYIDKLAHGLDWAAENLDKIAFEVGPGKGPGALPVSQATASTPLPDHKGQGHQQPPTHPGVEKARPSDAAGNALETNKATPGHAPTKIASLAERNAERLSKLGSKTKCCEHCGKEKAACTCSKTAALQEKNLARLSKVAEDRINPAHISAGAAVPPETSMSGQPGGMPVGGKPGPGMDLASTTTGAIGYTKGQAKAGPKADLGKYFKEPALSGATDKTLAAAFDSTSKAGTKFASAEQAEGEKVAAARAFVEELLEGA